MSWGRGRDSSGGNGESQTFYQCEFNSSHVFKTLDSKFNHEPSCPANPDRVPESENPERD